MIVKTWLIVEMGIATIAPPINIGKSIAHIYAPLSPVDMTNKNLLVEPDECLFNVARHVVLLRCGKMAGSANHTGANNLVRTGV